MKIKYAFDYLQIDVGCIPNKRRHHVKMIQKSENVDDTVKTN